MQIDLNQHNLKEQNAPLKKTWVTPNVEIISEDNIQSGIVHRGPEGQSTAFSTRKYNS